MRFPVWNKRRLFPIIMAALLAPVLWLLPLETVGNVAVEAFANTEGLSTVQIPETSEVDGEKIRLAEIAQIETSDQALSEKLKNIIIGFSPRPGHARQIDIQYVALRLEQSGVRLSTIRLLAPQQITVKRASMEIPAERIRDFILTYLNENLIQGKNSIRIRKLRGLKDITLPKGKLTYQVFRRQRGGARGSIPLSIVFKIDDQEQKKLWVTADLSYTAQVVVTRNTIGRHQMITEHDVRVQTREFSDLSADYVTRIEEILGKRSKRVIRADAMMKSDMVELPTLIKNRDVVRIIVEGNGLRITTLGEARAKGCKGDVIRVVNLDSKKMIYARVVDAHTVKVDF